MLGNTATEVLVFEKVFCMQKSDHYYIDAHNRKYDHHRNSKLTFRSFTSCKPLSRYGLSKFTSRYSAR